MNQYVKAVKTKREHAEARKAKYQEQLERKELIKKAMTDVLSDIHASSSDKVTAAEILLKCSEMR